MSLEVAFISILHFLIIIKDIALSNSWLEVHLHSTSIITILKNIEEIFLIAQRTCFQLIVINHKQSGLTAQTITKENKTYVCGLCGKRISLVPNAS